MADRIDDVPIVKNEAPLVGRSDETRPELLAIDVVGRLELIEAMWQMIESARRSFQSRSNEDIRKT